jgi:predicted TIM-barrel fold metal-dependent hydrolase
MIIDSYAFLGRWSDWPIKYTTPEKLVELMNRYGIDKAVISTLNFSDCDGGNEEVAKAVKMYPNRFIGFCVANPKAGEAVLDELKTAIMKADFKGLRLYPADHGYRFDEDPAWQLLMEEALKQKLVISIPVRLIANFGMPVCPPSEIGKVANRFPEAKIIIDGVNYGEYRETVQVMKKYNNTFFEASCFQYLGGVEHLVSTFGAGRVLFGTGLPLQYPACGFARIEKAEIAEEEKALIMGENIKKLLNL